MPWTDPLTGKPVANPIPAKPKSLPPDHHEWKVRPTSDPDSKGWIDLEVYSGAMGTISRGRMKP